MNTAALIRTSALVGYPELVIEMGGDPVALLARFNIHPEVLDKEDNVIPLRSFIHLLDATARQVDRLDFGLCLAAKQGFLLLGPIALIGLNSETVDGALRAMLKHLDFHCPAVLSSIDTTTDSRYPRITFDVDLGGGEALGKQIYEVALGNIYHELLIMTQGAFVPKAVLFRHSASMPGSVYQRYFHTKVFFEQEVNAVVITPEDLTRRLDTANPQLQKLVTEYVRQAAMSHPADVAAQVRFLMKRLMPSGNCGIKQVARNLCMHERTLQRELAKQGMTFEKTLESVRAERALDLIGNSAMPMTQIAAALGYSEQASFNRACRRWFSEPPARMRRGNRLMKFSSPQR